MGSRRGFSSLTGHYIKPSEAITTRMMQDTGWTWLLVTHGPLDQTSYRRLLNFRPTVVPYHGRIVPSVHLKSQNWSMTVITYLRA